MVTHNVGKIHLNDDRADPSEFENSPHIAEAIIEKRLALCGGYTGERVTTNLDDVTCIGCLQRIGRRVLIGSHLHGEEETHS